MQKKLTIKDIANKFDLSIGTISKILNGKSKASKETRKKVLDYVEEVGYYPTSSARNLKLQKSYSIGVVFSEELNIGLEHPYYAGVLQYFKSYVEKRGYEISFVINQVGEVKCSYLNWCRSKNIDGIYIVAGNPKDELIKELTESTIPCVTTEMGFSAINSVVSNNDHGIFQTVEYIKNKLQKNRLALISGPFESISFKERTEAFFRYTKKMGLDVDESDIVILKNFEFSTAYNSVEQLLEQVTVLPEVIVVSSDDIAFAVIRALYDKKINVPNDIQVIAFDDVPYAKRAIPALTTIRQNKEALGETAAEILLDLIKDGFTNYKKITRIDTCLVVRETTIDVLK